MSQEVPAVAASSVSLATRWHNFKLFGQDGFNFRDVLDLVNPLQHIPIVGNIYRNLTGDVAAPAIRIAGGALFGGPLGAAFAAASVIAHQLLSSDPDVIGMPATAAVADSAVTATPTEARGGWMVANSRAYPLAAPTAVASAPTVASGARRGGWLVQAAYGMNEIEEQRRHLFKAFRQQA